MRKKLLVPILILCMILPMIPVSVNAENGGSLSDTISWTLSDEGVLTISGRGDMPDFENLSEAPWYEERNNISSIKIEAGVTSIGSYAFYNCAADTVEIPDGITKINDRAFQHASRLVEINIPKSVTTIGSYAFLAVLSLKSINVDEENAVFKSVDGVLINNTNKYLIAYPPAKENKSYTVPEDVVTLDRYAFYYAENLRSIDLSSVKRIRDYAINHCTGLVEITFPESVSSIERSSAGTCANLKKAMVLNKNATFGATVFTEEHKDFVLMGYEDSTAATYAKENSLRFVPISETETYPYTINSLLVQTADGETLDKPQAGAGFITRITVTETTERGAEDYLAAAVYGTDGALLGISYAQADFIAGKPFSIGLYFRSLGAETGKIKAYVWDGLKQMSPLAETKGLDFTEQTNE